MITEHKLDYYIGTIVAIVENDENPYPNEEPYSDLLKDHTSREHIVVVTVPGVFENVVSYPGRNQIDEPKVGDIVVIAAWDSHYNSYTTYEKLKENDFVGFRAHGKMVSITQESITIGVFDENAEYYADEVVPDVSGIAHVRMDNEGNIDVHAAKDVTINIDGDATIKVKGNVTSEIDGNFDSTIHKNATLTIDGNSDSTIHGNATLTVDGNVTETVHGNVDQTVDGNVTGSVKGNTSLEVKGTSTTKITGDTSLEVEGNVSAEVNGKVSIKSNGESVSINAASGKVNIKSSGDTSVTSNGNITVKATSGLTTTGQKWTGNNGKVTPGSSGPFCALPVCPLTGAQHIGNISTGS